MLKRIMTALVGVSILVPFAIFCDTWSTVALTVLMSVIGVYEMLKCIGKEKNIYLLVLSETVAVSSQVLCKLMPGGRDYLSAMFMISIVFFVLCLSGAVFTAGCPVKSEATSEENKSAKVYRITFSEAVTAALMTVYVSFGLSSLILLSNMENSLIMFLLWFFIPWVCDGMAYFVGRALGKHKLIPSVSPKKTVEGAIGGVVGTLVLMLIFSLVMQFGFGYTPNYLTILIVTLIACPVSMCGDLIASLLKREYGVKDYGHLFPGHGGVLDRFDSCISTGPFIYIVCILFSTNALFA